MIITPNLIRATTSALSLNGVPLGFVPQHGTLNPIAPLDSFLQSNGLGNVSTYGFYAQTYPGVPWNGSQLLDILPDVVASGAIFEPAVMPMDDWDGYTADGNSQAVAVANVMRNRLKQRVGRQR